MKDGIYEIRTSKNSYYTLDISNAATHSGANVQLWASNGTQAQVFKVSHDSKGYVTFTNVKSGKVLDISNGTIRSGQNVWQYASWNASTEMDCPKKWFSLYNSFSIRFKLCIGFK